MAECPPIESLLPIPKGIPVLGKGGHGKVYKIGDYVLKEVKYSAKRLAFEKKEFEDEVKVLQKLSTIPALQPYLSRFCSSFNTGETGYILQVYEPTITLRECIIHFPKKSLAFPIGNAIQINLRKALLTLVGAGFYHRDIKPENILLRVPEDYARAVEEWRGSTLPFPSPTPEIIQSIKPMPIFIDFGLACQFDPKTKECVGINIAGTPEYMVPNFLPGYIHKRQPKMTILKRTSDINNNTGEEISTHTPTNVYIKTKLIPYHLSHLTEFYALCLVLEELYPLIDFTGHRREELEMLEFIGKFQRAIKMNTIKRRRNLMGFGKILTVEGVGKGPAGGTRKRSQKKRRASRKASK